MAEKKPARAGSRTNATKKVESGGGAAEDGAAAGTGRGTQAGAGRGTGAKAKPPARAGSSSAAGSASGAAKPTGARAGSKAGEKSGGKTGGKSGTKSGGSRGGSGAAASKRGGSEGGLQGELRSFVTAHPHGWNHEDWHGLLGRLQQGGHDVSDHSRIGMELEKERLVQTLEQKKVQGLGPTKIRSIADRFGTVWSLRHASVDEIASVKGLKREQAEAVHAAVN